jgi:hypothetical protein
LPRRRKRIDYAPALRSGSAAELINGVRTAFEQLRPRAEANEEETKKAIASAVHLIVFGLSRATAHPPAWFRLAEQSADGEQHRQVLRDRMAAKIIKEPPANTRFISPDGVPYFIGLWQRLSPNDRRIIDAQIEAEIGPVASKRGAPRSIEGRFIANECLSHFERITGRRATVVTDPETKKPCGAFYDLVASVFRALAIPDSAETCARAACMGRGRTRQSIVVVRT